MPTTPALSIARCISLPSERTRYRLLLSRPAVGNPVSIRGELGVEELRRLVLDSEPLLSRPTGDVIQIHLIGSTSRKGRGKVELLFFRRPRTDETDQVAQDCRLRNAHGQHAGRNLRVHFCLVEVERVIRVKTACHRPCWLCTQPGQPGIGRPYPRYHRRGRSSLRTGSFRWRSA